MIDQADERVVEWARRIVPGVPVAIAPPGGSDDEAGIRIHLLSVHPVSAMRNLKRPPLELALRYLITTTAADSAEAHRWLGTLVFAALEVAEWQVEREPLGAEVWRAFGVAPRAAFIAVVPLRLERPEQEAPLVTKPLIVNAVPTTALAGVIVGPGEVPIAGAAVEIPSLQLFTRSDERGAFRFPTVPATAGVSLVVRARRRSRSVEVQPGAALRIRFDDLEG